MLHILRLPSAQNVDREAELLEKLFGDDFAVYHLVHGTYDAAAIKAAAETLGATIVIGFPPVEIREALTPFWQSGVMLMTPNQPHFPISFEILACRTLSP